MQSIDESTFIDDTLITCAEYQLFIDEMRELGQSYQPLHWYSDRFPDGQAREPILGVRQSDAVMFCEWMSRREGDGWKYRLPTEEEIGQVSLKPVTQSLIGYWMNELHYFTWAGTVPRDPRGVKHFLEEIRRELAIFSENAYERDLIHAQTSISVPEYKPGSKSFGIASYQDRSQYESAQAEADQRALEQARMNANTRARMLEDSCVRTFARAHVLDLDLVFARAQALDLHIVFVDVDIPYRAEVLKRDIHRAHDLVFEHAYTYGEAFDSVLDVFIDLYTLLERMSGLSNAFEGIRIMKERVE